jgi:hypothetical protein
MASWTCYICGAGIDTDNPELFAILVGRHQDNCKDED